MTAHGIMIHHFHKPGERHAQGSLTAEQFSDMIGFLGPKNILSAHEWLERSQAGALEPQHLCLTFDDNLKSQYDIALPVLEAHGLTSFFFIYSAVCEGVLENLEIYRLFRYACHDSIEDFYQAFETVAQELAPSLKQAMEGFNPDEYLAAYAFYTPQDKRFRYIRDQVLGPEHYDRIVDRMIELRGMTREQLSRNLWVSDDELRTLSGKGHIIGLHSYTHPTRIAGFSKEKQKEEYRKNDIHLTRAIGEKPITMSHPCGSYNEDTLDLLTAMGVALGFRSDMAMAGAHGPLEYPRRDHADVVREMR